MTKFQPFQNKQQYLEWAQSMVSMTLIADRLNPAHKIADDIAKYDPEAAELFLKNAATLTELAKHLSSKLEIYSEPVSG